MRSSWDPEQQQQVDAVACEAGFGNQQVERERGEIVCLRLDLRIAVLAHDLQVAAALVAGLGLDRGLRSRLGPAAQRFQRLVVDALRAFAVRALDPDHVPLCGA